MVNSGKLEIHECWSICHNVEWLGIYSWSKSMLASVEIVMCMDMWVHVCACTACCWGKMWSDLMEKKKEELLKLLQIVESSALVQRKCLKILVFILHIFKLCFAENYHTLENKQSFSKSCWKLLKPYLTFWKKLKYNV